jgi:ABC-2 type transport system permease protein
MSTSDVAATPREAPRDAALDAPPRRSVRPRFLGSELRLVFTRRRNQAMLVVLAAAPVLLGAAIRLSNRRPRGGGPAFIGQITGNGLFLAFTSLVVTLPLFLPLVVSVVSGESVAGEASTGTLRSLLVVPVARTRLLAVKYAGIACYALAATAVVGVSAVITGFALFPTGPVTLLSGDVIPLSAALVRVALVVLYVAAMMLAVAALGLFISTLTEVPLASMAATAIVVIVLEILDAIPQLSSLAPYLFTHWWLSFGDLVRDPVSLDALGRGLLVTLGYVAVLGSLAWARLTTRDVTS